MSVLRDAAPRRPAFMDHVGATPACEPAFDAWRARVADDLAGGWAG